jgi:hypothetical protein
MTCWNGIVAIPTLPCEGKHSQCDSEWVAPRVCLGIPPSTQCFGVTSHGALQPAQRGAAGAQGAPAT